MRVALVHDYIGEFGGAERVLLALSEIWPDAPIYTAFYREGPAWEKFKSKDIRVSWAHHIPGFSTWLHSPLRFLAPFIWGSFVRQLADYDLVISSVSWYVTKGFGQGGPTSPRHGRATLGVNKPVEVCYCHTPPRYLYGYPTSVKKSWLTDIYSALVNPFMRWYDKRQAQKVDYFIANSKNVQDRIKKYYGRDSIVIYPPVEIAKSDKRKAISDKREGTRGEYYLIVSRIVGGKGIEMAVEAAQNLGIPLKIVGSSSGHAEVYERLKQKAGNDIEFLGFVDDQKLAELYQGAKALLALAQDEDFGITPVEAMQAGTPVIAYNGGGYKETVKDGETGLLFDNYSVDGLIGAIKKFEKMKLSPDACKKQGEKFSKERFKEEIKEFISSKIKD